MSPSGLLKNLSVMPLQNLAQGVSTCAAAVDLWMSEQSSYVPGSDFSAVSMISERHAWCCLLCLLEAVSQGNGTHPASGWQRITLTRLMHIDTNMLLAFSRIAEHRPLHPGGLGWEPRAWVRLRCRL